MRVLLDVITMQGSRYVLVERDGSARFPAGELAAGETPGAAARRILKESTGLEGPKLEVVDMRPAGGDLQVVFRALVGDAPKTPHRTAGRYELPEDLGRLTGAYVEEALKTSFAYKLTRA